jgi:Flp pilus assembly CpaE family ATPase
MPVPVLTAVTGATWEADLVSELGRADHGLTVVRRCVDLAELLSAAAAGTAEAVLLSADLRRLDRDAVMRLMAAGVAVIGLVNPGDGESERRLRQIGVPSVLPADAGAAKIAAEVGGAIARLRDTPDGDAIADPRAALPRLDAPLPPPTRPAGRGRVVAVWGPTGAPGRTTVAVGIADEAARLGVPTLLVDADVYGGVVASVLGLLDEAPGLAAACRLAASSQLDPAALARLAWSVNPMLRVLTGIVRAERWTELRPYAVDVVLDQARHLSRLTVVDCGFCLERDEEVAYDTAAPRRNGATLAVLRAADSVICVGGADPVALQRLIRAVSDARELLDGRVPLVVVNRVRKVVIPGSPRKEILAALARYAGVTDVVLLPHDGPAADAALGSGRTIAEVASDSALRTGLRDLAQRLTGVSNAGRRDRRSRAKVPQS